MVVLEHTQSYLIPVLFSPVHTYIFSTFNLLVQIDSPGLGGYTLSSSSSWSCDQGVTVAPSGLLPSNPDKPFGSNHAGILAASRALFMILFTAVCQYDVSLCLHMFRMWLNKHFLKAT